MRVASPETRYARSGDVSIAYQVSGDGAFDLVVFPGVGDQRRGALGGREVPSVKRLGCFARVIRFEVLYGSAPRFTRAPGYPWGPTREDYLAEIDDYSRRWGTRELAADQLRSSGAEATGELTEYFAKRMRQSASTERAIESFLVPVAAGAPPDAAEPERVLATVLFTDIVGSTAKAAELGDRRWRELLGEHHALIRRELARYRGRELDTAGDGFFAAFDGPARAIRCGCAVSDAVRELGLNIRAGLHTRPQVVGF
jgi:hypothetical protein